MVGILYRKKMKMKKEYPQQQKGWRNFAVICAGIENLKTTQTKHWGPSSSTENMEKLTPLWSNFFGF